MAAGGFERAFASLPAMAPRLLAKRQLAALRIIRDLKLTPVLDAADVPAAPVLEREQVFNEPQMVANNMFVRLEHPIAGPVHVANDVHVAQLALGNRRLQLPHGRHGESVLLLGLD